MDGRHYPIEDWAHMLRMIAEHEPLARQVERWLREAQGDLGGD